MTSTAKVFTTAAALAMVAAIGISNAGPASAQVEVFTDETAFTAATGATEVDIPDSETAFPSTTCGGAANTGDGPEVSMPFDGNNLTVTPIGASTLCIFDDGVTRPINNTDPNVMDGNTIVGNGEDNYLLTFDTAVHAVGVRLLTNFNASETFTFLDAGDNTIAVVNDADLATDPNERQFVGFKSLTPIASIEIDTTGGASQNEGIDRIKVAADFQVNINVHPGSDPNPLNLSSGGSTPVAIFGTADFDVTLIDISSLVFADSGVKTVGKSAKELCNVEDIGSFDTAFFDNLDPDADGYDDLVCHFVTAEIGGLTVGENLPVELMGDPTGGGSIIGTDVVKVVKE